MNKQQIIEVLRWVADDALQSSEMNGEYNMPFYVAYIVLSNLANKIAALDD